MAQAFKLRHHDDIAGLERGHEHFAKEAPAIRKNTGSYTRP
jgi:hypothetical protein